MRRLSIIAGVVTLLMASVFPAAVATPPRSDTTALIQDAVPIAGAEGTATLTRNDNGTFTWTLRASGMTPGNAYTVWVGNFDGGDGRIPFDDGGHGGGGVVGGSGAITVSGNQCVSVLDPGGLTGGFEPATPKDCDFVDSDGQIMLFLIDHGEWDKGDMTARWTPFGGSFEGDMFAFFPGI